MNASVQRVAAAVSMLIASAGCVIQAGVAGPPVTPVFSKIVPGTTTKNEVLTMLGAPTRAHQYRAEAGETWEYPYFDAYQDTRIFWVEFRADGIVSKTDDTKDFYAYPYRGR